MAGHQSQRQPPAAAAAEPQPAAAAAAGYPALSEKARSPSDRADNQMPFFPAFFRTAAMLAMIGTASADAPLQLQLLGIFASSDMARSTALVSNQGQEPMAARIGQFLPGGFRLQAIAHDRVLLARDGRTFQLILHGRTQSATESLPLPSQASIATTPFEPASAPYADACNALARFDQAQREELQSLGVCFR
ncbi:MULTISPECIES: type II secretion system protein N [Pseudomonadaceae]|uniref:type II secretion system protein N n=1 Tax=Pseudomonadaceae TaxID=135621 RepID=UPI0014042CD8|nr:MULTISPECIES: type II secretion system protein N [unclassified Pseudomonas]MBA1276266.1 hypothetical protein [Stutzerimonas stutzeri]QXY92748.1 hypothetical protein GYM54_14710 [Pseudomonas sp. MTM4]